jgi:hypothetical protein
MDSPITILVMNVYSVTLPAINVQVPLIINVYNVSNLLFFKLVTEKKKKKNYLKFNFLFDSII